MPRGTQERGISGDEISRQDIWDVEPDAMAPVLQPGGSLAVRREQPGGVIQPCGVGTYQPDGRCTDLLSRDQGVPAILYISGVGTQMRPRGTYEIFWMVLSFASEELWIWPCLVEVMPLRQLL